MNIFDFLTQDEIDDAPEDGALAFTYLVHIAQARLTDVTQKLNWRQDDDRELGENARLGFVSIVVSLGKSYDIDPFKSMDVPRLVEFDYSKYRQFKADLDYYMAQLVIGNSIRGRRDSILLSVEAKERIRSHIHHIKQAIDKAALPDVKRASLHSKLHEFELALDKERFNAIAAARVVLEILSVTANIAGLADSASFHKLLSNVMVIVGEAKAADREQRKLPLSDPPPIMLPPRRETIRPAPKEDFDLDDEIPF